MSISFQPVRLDTSLGDDEAVLAFRGDSLFAVLSRLGPIHGESAGKWYVEIFFSQVMDHPRTPFSSLDELEQWVADHTEQ